MQVQVHYSNFENSQWVDQFIERRVDKLSRFLNPSTVVHVSVNRQKGAFLTTLAIHNFHHDFAFDGEGDNLFESFSLAVERASRALREQKRMIKDKIHKKISSFYEEAP